MPGSENFVPFHGMDDDAELSTLFPLRAGAGGGISAFTALANVKQNKVMSAVRIRQRFTFLMVISRLLQMGGCGEPGVSGHHEHSPKQKRRTSPKPEGNRASPTRDVDLPSAVENGNNNSYRRQGGEVCTDVQV